MTDPLPNDSPKNLAREIERMSRSQNNLSEVQDASFFEAASVLRSADTKLTNMVKENARLETEIQRLQDEAAANGATIAKKETADLEGDISQLRTDLDAERKKNVSLLDQVADLTQVLAVVRRDLADMTSQRDSSDSKCANLMQRLRAADPDSP